MIICQVFECLYYEENKYQGEERYSREDIAKYTKEEKKAVYYGLVSHGWRSNGVFRFSDLPVEIRDLVYEELMPTPGKYIPNYEYHKPDLHRFQNIVSMCLVNKQVSREYRARLDGTMTFELDVKPKQVFFLKDLEFSAKNTNFQIVRSWHVNVAFPDNPREVLQLRKRLIELCQFFHSSKVREITVDAHPWNSWERRWKFRRCGYKFQMQ
ncbi:hypothetical protein EJ08DRAFT_17132 [Tothia fuscella]|uniref:F-box domain-containing protein n=1 Tax=Tothia fuscella TaxID=1048955 RepID=A0A9P4NYW3_9PEZI|nr:hypothetical protein EJ08DRAFT_17132 [Tothia fuscella]